MTRHSNSQTAVQNNEPLGEFLSGDIFTLQFFDFVHRRSHAVIGGLFIEHLRRKRKHVELETDIKLLKCEH